MWQKGLGRSTYSVYTWTVGNNINNPEAIYRPQITTTTTTHEASSVDLIICSSSADCKKATTLTVCNTSKKNFSTKMPIQESKVSNLRCSPGSSRNSQTASEEMEAAAVDCCWHSNSKPVVGPDEAGGEWHRLRFKGRRAADTISPLPLSPPSFILLLLLLLLFSSLAATVVFLASLTIKRSTRSEYLGLLNANSNDPIFRDDDPPLCLRVCVCACVFP